MDGEKELALTEKQPDKHSEDLTGVGREKIDEHAADVSENNAAFFDGFDDVFEIVVDKDNIAGVLDDGRSVAHSDADVGVGEGRDVVDAVAGHGDDFGLFDGLKNTELVFRCHTSKN